MRAFVTGAGGFIGSTLIEELGTLGFEVDALLCRASGRGAESGSDAVEANLAGLAYRRVEADISDPRDEERLRRALREADYVFHLTGDADRLARLAADERPGLSRFVHVSSLAAAGPSRASEPRLESMADQPVSAYGASKLAGERAVLRYKTAFPVSIVRPPAIYGPRDKSVFLFVQAVARNFMPLLRGAGKDGHKYYSLIHVRDLCRGIIQSALAPVGKVPSGEVFFLAGDGVHSYQDIMETIAEALGRDPLKIRLPRFALAAAAAALSGAARITPRITRRRFPPGLDRLGELVPDYWVCSNRKARELLGFQPEFDLPSGMSHAIDWYRRHKWI